MEVLRDKRFRALVLGQAVNGIGSWCALIAIWGYASDRFNATPWQVAILGLTWTVPGALLGPFAGIPTDRWDPRRVLMTADALAALCAIAMAFTDTYWSLVVWSTAQGFVKSFAAPAFGALAPRVVPDEQLPQANALLSTAMQLSIAFGPLLGAGAISASGARGAFLVDAATYLIAIIVVFPLTLSPKVGTADPGTAWAEAQQGWRAVIERPVVVRLFVAAAGVYLLWGSGVTLEPLYVKHVLHRTPETFALLQTAFGVMMVAMGLVITRVGDRATKTWIVALAAGLSGVCAIGYLSTPNVVIAFASIAMWGMITPWFTTPMRTLLQRETPMEVHGRVFALDETLRSWSMAIATGTAGIAFSNIGYRWSGVLYGSMPIIGAVCIATGIARRRSAASHDPWAGPATENGPAAAAEVNSAG